MPSCGFGSSGWLQSENKKSEMIDQYKDLARDVTKPVEHEGDRNTNCSWSSRNGSWSAGKKTWGIGNQREYRDHLDLAFWGRLE